MTLENIKQSSCIRATSDKGDGSCKGGLVMKATNYTAKTFWG